MAIFDGGIFDSGIFDTDGGSSTVESSFPVSAVIFGSGAGSFSVSAYIGHRFPISAVIQKTLPGSFTLAADITVVSSAFLRISQSPVEVLLQPTDRYVRVSQAPVEVLLQPTDRYVRVSQAPVEVLLQPTDRYVRLSQAVIEVLVPRGAGTQVGSFSASAFLQGTISATFAADAIVKRTQQGTWSASAIVLGFQGGSYSLSASIVTAGVASWTTPVTLVHIQSAPTLGFRMPLMARNMHFQIQLDTVITFDSPDLRVVDSLANSPGWEFWNGAGWAAIPVAGVPNTFAGNEARYTVQVPLADGTWYRRVRGGQI